MSRTCVRFLVMVAMLLMTVSSAGAITKTAKSLGVLEINGGYTVPTGGSYDYLGSISLFNDIGSSVSGSELYNSSYTLGLSYGVVRGGHWLFSAGFQYSHIRVKVPFKAEDGQTYVITGTLPHYNQYDIRLNGNYLFSDLESQPWSLYLGGTFAAGITSEGLHGYSSRSETNVALGLNFGAEVKIWQDASKRNFVTLASANSWDFVGSGYRPLNLTIGLAVKAYVRP